MPDRDYSRDPIPYSPQHKNYLPLGVPTISDRRPPRLRWWDKLILLVFLAAILAYFAFGIWIDDLPVPRWRGIPGWGGGKAETHLHGLSSWLLLGAFLCYVLYRIRRHRNPDPVEDPSLPSSLDLKDLVPRHGDKLATALAWAGWLLFLATLVSMFFVPR